MNNVLKVLTKQLSRDESRKIEKVLYGLHRRISVLEVGCGLGDKMKLLQRMGFNSILGVEKNPLLVKRAADRGLNVLSSGEFRDLHPRRHFDLLVMSHVIEHLSYDSFTGFMDFYLDHLRSGGWLLIITPILHTGFFMDLDHTRPYYPQGMQDYFGNGGQQIQVHSRHRLKLRDIRFRRSPFKLRMNRALLLKRNDFAPRLCNLLLAFLFKGSFGIIGRKTAWIGLFEKQ